ncbi:hypothetical protein ZOSMA_33G01350 [Zostera marina]|uniref:Pentatricopeptide repeat-containing protein n=1 Tax=Zostera marina TaxID=29655 RepID=A0A0K9PA44_ZOSMR|nr:hypothetical protein ZOSMA_33G01350 [Zostera marina]
MGTPSLARYRWQGSCLIKCQRETYVQFGFFKEGLELFKEMQVVQVHPNHATMVGALTACAFLGALDQGR